MAEGQEEFHKQDFANSTSQQVAVEATSGNTKACPYCKEQVHNEAIKCRHCQSMLLPLQMAESKQSDSDKVTYILDQGLVRFGKFTGGVLAIFLIVGTYLFGFKLEASLERVHTVQDGFANAQKDLEKTQREVSKAQTDVTRTQEDFVKARADLTKMQGDFNKARADLTKAQEEVAELQMQFDLARKKLVDREKEIETYALKLGERVQTVMASSEVLVVGTGSIGLQQAVRQIEDKLLAFFRSALPNDQYLALEKAIRAHGLRREIYTAEGGDLLPGKLVRLEGQSASGDADVDHAYENIGIVHEFFQAAFGRDLGLDFGGPVVVSVHYQKSFNNAFWDGKQVVSGDGDGTVFRTGGFTSLGLVAIQLGHLVIQRTAGLEYQGQSGALNSHFADVFSVLAEQWKERQSADKATWLVGAGLFAPEAKGIAMRSMKAPGTAYDSPVLGKDRQPSHMKDFATLPNTPGGDFGGVHVNSGIPNRAFYEVANLIGGNAWERPGIIWYNSLLDLNSKASFQEFADTTFSVAGRLYGSQEQEAVRKGWEVVGIRVGTR